MIRNSMRSTRLLSWRTLRWAIAIPTLPLVWWACTSHPLTQPNPSPEQQTDIYISVSPNRLLDLVFHGGQLALHGPQATEDERPVPQADCRAQGSRATRPCLTCASRSSTAISERAGNTRAGAAGPRPFPTAPSAPTATSASSRCSTRPPPAPSTLATSSSNMKVERR